MRAKSITVRLTYDEAEAIMVGIKPGDYKHNHLRVRGRGKISAALLARSDYVTPLERARNGDVVPLGIGLDRP